MKVFISYAVHHLVGAQVRRLYIGIQNLSKKHHILHYFLVLPKQLILKLNKQENFRTWLAAEVNFLSIIGYVH